MACRQSIILDFVRNFYNEKFLKFHTSIIKTQTFKFNLYEIKTKPIDTCIDIHIVNSKPIKESVPLRVSTIGIILFKNCAFGHYLLKAYKI